MTNTTTTTTTTTTNNNSDKLAKRKLGRRTHLYEEFTTYLPYSALSANSVK